MIPCKVALVFTVLVAVLTVTPFLCTVIAEPLRMIVILSLTLNGVLCVASVVHVPPLFRRSVCIPQRKYVVLFEYRKTMPAV